jgi:hypothetical protein
MARDAGQKTYTRFAPEQHYNRDGEMDIILGAAQTALKQSSTGKNLEVGKTAFFAPTAGTRPVRTASGKLVPTNLPSYRIVDRNGKVILDNNMKPIVVTPQSVYQARGLKTAEEFAAFNKEANAARADLMESTDSIGRQKPIKRGGDFSGAFTNRRMTIQEAQALRDKRDQDRANK